MSLSRAFTISFRLISSAIMFTMLYKLSDAGEEIYSNSDGVPAEHTYIVRNMINTVNYRPVN